MTYRKNAADRLHARIILNSSFLSPSSGYSAFSFPTCVALPLYAVALLDRYRNSKSTPRCAGWFSMIASRRKQIRKYFVWKGDHILCGFYEVSKQGDNFILQEQNLIDENKFNLWETWNLAVLIIQNIFLLY